MKHKYQYFLVLFFGNQYLNIGFFDIFDFSRNIDFLRVFSIALEIFRYRSVRVLLPQLFECPPTILVKYHIHRPLFPRS